MLACLEGRLEELRPRLAAAARHLTGARALTARLYGVGPVTALAMTACNAATCPSNALRPTLVNRTRTRRRRSVTGRSIVT